MDMYNCDHQWSSSPPLLLGHTTLPPLHIALSARSNIIIAHISHTQPHARTPQVSHYPPLVTRPLLVCMSGGASVLLQPCSKYQFMT